MQELLRGKQGWFQTRSERWQWLGLCSSWGCCRVKREQNLRGVRNAAAEEIFGATALGLCWNLQRPHCKSCVVLCCFLRSRDRGRGAPVPPGCILSNIPLSLTPGTRRGGSLLSLLPKLCRCSLLPCAAGRREERAKQFPSIFWGSPAPRPTLCGHEVSAPALGDARVGLLLVLHVPCRGGGGGGRRRARRGRVSVSVCLCVATLSEGRRTTLCGFPASFSPWCLTQDVPCLHSQQRSIPARGLRALGVFPSRVRQKPLP